MYSKFINNGDHTCKNKNWKYDFLNGYYNGLYIKFQVGNGEQFNHERNLYGGKKREEGEVGWNYHSQMSYDSYSYTIKMLQKTEN